MITCYCYIMSEKSARNALIISYIEIYAVYFWSAVRGPRFTHSLIPAPALSLCRSGPSRSDPLVVPAPSYLVVRPHILNI
jgi:hypothetical protein